MSEALLSTTRSEELLPTSPYKGLIPYTEADAAFFFGREAEREIIISNLMSWRLTLLYGASGVGKSSLLQAEVTHQLRRMSEDNLAERGRPGHAVVVFNSWRDDPIAGLTKQVEESVSAAWNGKKFAPLPSSRLLAQVLQAWTERLEGELYIILDQFEEYFLYHPQEEGEGTFAYEFPRVVNRPDLRVSFLVSIREDALAKLDCFKGRIPELFDNYLRIEHLNIDAAREAIEKPLAEYNRRQLSGKAPITIEPPLVNTVLEQVKTGQVVLGDTGLGQVANNTQSEAQIETPYLQIVMSRLWEEEQRARSSVLRLETLNRLGGADQIIRTHLDAVMSALPPAEQEIAARLFRYLVTPSGTKIAYSVPDLAAYTGLSIAQIAPVLEKLSGSGMRILHPVVPPLNQPDAVRYEIFHDVLASAILDWSSRYAQAQARAATEKELAESQQRISELASVQAETEKKLTRVGKRLKRLAIGFIPIALIALAFAVILGIIWSINQAIDYDTYEAWEATISAEVPKGNVVMFNEIGVRRSVLDKMVDKGFGVFTVVAVEDEDFNPRKLAEITNRFKRPAVGIRLNAAIANNSAYALVTVTRLEPNGGISTKTVRVNHNAGNDKWEVAR